MPPPEVLAPILAISLAAGLIQGLSGFGSALVAVPLFVLVLPVESVVPLMALLGGTVSFLNVLHLRRALHASGLGRLLLGYLIGTPLGLVFLTRAPEAAVLGGLGAFISAYALLSLAGRQPRTRWLREWRVALGTAAGALGAAFSTNGPPVILHVAAHPEWGPDRQKGTLVLFLLAAGLITIVGHAASGLITASVLGLYLWCLPTLLLGTLAGTRLYRRLGEHDYRRLVFLLVLAAGMLMVGRAVAG